MLTRRWIFLPLAAVASMWLLYHPPDYPFNRQAAPVPEYTLPPKVDNGRSPWNNRPINYPLAHLVSLPHGKPKRLPSIQHQFPSESAQDKKTRLERQQVVKNTFIKCWRSYRTHAWMRDELSPLSGNGRDTFGGWAATLVDALDTLWIMELKDEFYEAAEAAVKIDFSRSTDATVNIFETTIRYLGGFLAAYDLSGERKLLEKAVDVGEMLLIAFDTPNHLPVTRWDWKQAADGKHQEAPSWMLVSEIGSLSLEFTRLSQLTGDMRWYDAISRITDLFDSQQNRTKLPGMWPVVVDPKAEDLTGDTSFTLGGMSDSLYEYFPKQYALLGGLSPVYQKLYQDSMSVATEKLFFRPLTPDNADIIMSGDVRASDEDKPLVIEPKAQHLTCFVGGMLALGGRLFSNNEHLAMAHKITKGCIWAYKNGPRHLMPEIAHFVLCASNGDCSWSRDQWTAAIRERQKEGEKVISADEIIREKRLPEGFVEMDDRRYILRPEAIESVFIMYRITGEVSYLDAAWEMFNAIQAATETSYANAAISDIAGGPADGLAPQDDRMESFWLAETLKYFYLIFSEPELISLDKYVLNTEAHPLKMPA